jgi:D-threo-aldose 1-dehydrogenase
MRAERIYALCEGLGVEVGAAALQFPLAHRAVACVVAGMRSTAEVESGVDRMQVSIPGSLWLALRDAKVLLPEVPTP